MISFQIHTLENNRTTIIPTSLRTNEHYVVYYNFVFKTLLTELFPYCSLIFLNFCIYREIRRSIKLQQSMRCTHSQKEEIKSANVVVSIMSHFRTYTFSLQNWGILQILLRIKIQRPSKAYAVFRKCIVTSWLYIFTYYRLFRTNWIASYIWCKNELIQQKYFHVLFIRQLLHNIKFNYLLLVNLT